METIGKYQIVKIGKGSPGDADLLGAQEIHFIEEMLEKGANHIVLVFAENQFRSHSRQISLLLLYVRKIVDAGGRLAAIIPDEDLYNLLFEMGVSRIFSIFRSEEEMREKIAGTE